MRATSFDPSQFTPITADRVRCNHCGVTLARGSRKGHSSNPKCQRLRRMAAAAQIEQERAKQAGYVDPEQVPGASTDFGAVCNPLQRIDPLGAIRAEIFRSLAGDLEESIWIPRLTKYKQGFTGDWDRMAESWLAWARNHPLQLRVKAIKERSHPGQGRSRGYGSRTPTKHVTERVFIPQWAAELMLSIPFEDLGSGSIPSTSAGLLERFRRDKPILTWVIGGQVGAYDGIDTYQARYRKVPPVELTPEHVKSTVASLAENYAEIVARNEKYADRIFQTLMRKGELDEETREERKMLAFMRNMGKETK